MRTRRATVVLLALGAGVLAGSVRAELGALDPAGQDLQLGVEDRALDRLEVALRGIGAELGGLTAREEAVRTALTSRVRALYRITRPGTAPVGGGFEAVRLHLARVRHLERVTAAQARELAQVGNERARLASEHARLSAELAPTRARLETRRVDPYERVEPGPELAMDSASARPEPFYGLRVVDEAPLDVFEDKRGALASPVRGEVRLVDVGGRYDDDPGLDIQSPAGTPVRAVAAGRVAFSDREAGQGHVVILDHGRGFSTLYGGLGSVDVALGDDLSEGARIGNIGSAHDPAALHFEVRRRGRALPPREWLGF